MPAINFFSSVSENQSRKASALYLSLQWALPLLIVFVQFTVVSNVVPDICSGLLPPVTMVLRWLPGPWRRIPPRGGSWGSQWACGASGLGERWAGSAHAAPGEPRDNGAGLAGLRRLQGGGEASKREPSQDAAHWPRFAGVLMVLAWLRCSLACGWAILRRHVDRCGTVRSHTWLLPQHNPVRT